MRAAMAGMLAMAVAMGIGRFVYTPILPLMIGADVLDPSGAGVVAGLNYLGYLVGAMAASLGFFAPHRRVWFFIALSISVATTAGMGLTDDLTTIAVLRFLAGPASAFSMIFSTAIVLAKLAEEDRSDLYAIHFGGIGFGIAASAILVSILAAAGISWSGAWIASGLAGAAGLALVALLLPETTREARPPGRREAGSGRPRLPLVLFVSSYGFFGFGYVVTATFINAMAKSEPALAPVEPYVWIVVGVAGMPSVWIWSLVARRIGFSATYALGCVVEAFGVILGVTVFTPAALLLSAFLLGVTFIAITAIGIARSRELAPANPAGVIAAMTAAFGLGQMVGPVVAGWLYDRQGDLVLASCLAALALVVAGILAPLGASLSRR